jgi:hypothetical protein
MRHVVPERQAFVTQFLSELLRHFEIAALQGIADAVKQRLLAQTGIGLYQAGKLHPRTVQIRTFEGMYEVNQPVRSTPTLLGWDHGAAAAMTARCFDTHA